MAGIELAPEVLDDFDRLFDDQAQFSIEDTAERMGDVIAAIQILARIPLIGPKTRGGKRELVIGLMAALSCRPEVGDRRPNARQAVRFERPV